MRSENFKEAIKKIDIEIEEHKSQIQKKQEERKALIDKEQTERRNHIILTYILQKIDEDQFFKEQLFYEIQTNYKNENKEILSDLFYIEFDNQSCREYIPEIEEYGCYH